MEFLTALLGALTAVVGLTRELLPSKKKKGSADKDGESRRPRARFKRALVPLLWMTLCAGLLTVAIQLYLKNRYPTALVYAQMTAYDRQTGAQSLQMLQSYFRAWSGWPAMALEKEFGETGLPAGARTGSVGALYVTGDVDKMRVIPPVASTLRFKEPLNSGEQHHLVLEATTALGRDAAGSDSGGTCADWAGLDYEYRGPTRTSEIVFVIDYRAIARGGDCRVLFVSGGQPRYALAATENQELSCSSDFKRMTEVTGSGGCVWATTLRDTGPGLVFLKWDLDSTTPIVPVEGR